MDVWSSGQANDVKREEEEVEDYELPDSGKDALIVVLDVRKKMFETSSKAQNLEDDGDDEENSTWFHVCIKLLIKMLKSKIIANDNSLLSIVFFGTQKKCAKSTLENVFEFQELGFPSAQRIKDLQELLEQDEETIQQEYQVMDPSMPISISNALWHSGIAFSNANLKKKDSQRVWIFTNDDTPTLPDQEETLRVQKQIQNHVELKRTLNLFYMCPPNKNQFNLSSFYGPCGFKDFASSLEDQQQQEEEEEEEKEKKDWIQPAFGIHSLHDLMETSLRKKFRKRRLSTFGFYITKKVSIGVELYALVVSQKKNTPVYLDAETNLALKTETKWLCEDTGVYLTQDQMKKYIEYGGQHVYFSKDDIVQVKFIDTPGIQLICFKSVKILQQQQQQQVNLRTSYFLYPSENGMKAFIALLKAMKNKNKMAIARLIARKTSEPRLVALIPQEEVLDELGQVQPSGFQVIFLPYCDDLREIDVDPSTSQAKPDSQQVQMAKQLIDKLYLKEMPHFENPELQKHYASIQALALQEEALSFDESKDTTVPDEQGFQQQSVIEAIENFEQACGGQDELNKPFLKRPAFVSSSKTKHKNQQPAKKKTTATSKKRGEEEEEELDKTHWLGLSTTMLHKKTVSQLKAFLEAHGLAVSGKKADLLDRIENFLTN